MFGLSKPYFLGIDFGTSSIKAVELTLKDNNPVLVNYGEVSLARLERGVLSSSTHTYDEEIFLYLRALLERLHPKSKNVYVAMPAFIGLISLIELPEMKEHELQEAIRFEAHKYIPSPLSEVALSWEVVGQRVSPTDGRTIMEVLLVAALNKEVQRYEDYIRQAKLNMQLLELETFSLARSIAGNDEGFMLIIDIGSHATNLILTENGVVHVSRNLDTGGKDLTRTLTESLGITEERAESLKKSGKDFLNNPESALVFPALQMIASEAERVLDSYHAKYPEFQCKEIILSGGTAQFTGLTQYYSERLGLPVRIGNPWHRIQYDPSLEAAIQKLGTSFSIALGLALNGVDAKLRKKPKQQESFSLKKFLTKEI